MFRNRWAALLFVGITLAGVTTLVGTERGDGALQQAAEQFTQQKADAERLTADPAPSTLAETTAETDESVVLAGDEDLIDPATGEDPTPLDEFAAANPQNPEEIADNVVIVSRDAAGQPSQAAQPAPQQ